MSIAINWKFVENCTLSHSIQNGNIDSVFNLFRVGMVTASSVGPAHHFQLIYHCKPRHKNNTYRFGVCDQRVSYTMLTMMMMMGRLMVAMVWYNNNATKQLFWWETSKWKIIEDVLQQFSPNVWWSMFWLFQNLIFRLFLCVDFVDGAAENRWFVCRKWFMLNVQLCGNPLNGHFSAIIGHEWRIFISSWWPLTLMVYLDMVGVFFSFFFFFFFIIKSYLNVLLRLSYQRQIQ